MFTDEYYFTADDSDAQDALGLNVDVLLFSIQFRVSERIQRHAEDSHQISLDEPHPGNADYVRVQICLDM